MLIYHSVILYSVHGIKSTFLYPVLALRKKLDPLALQSDCGDLKGWKRSILNHLYWCASSTPDGDGAVMSAKWQSLLYHLTDVHQGFDTPEFTTCSHGDLTGEARHKKWMKEGWTTSHFI